MQGAKILDHGGHQAYFGSHFSKMHGPPNHWHGAIHLLVVPHLVNFIAIGRELSAGKLHNQLFTLNAFEADRPFALLNRAGRLVECSKGFEAILRSRQILGLHDHTLVGIHAEHRRLVERFLASALGPRSFLDPPLPIRLVTPDSPRGLILRAVPLVPSNDVFAIFRPAILVTLTDLDQPYRVRRQELVALFGLTEREADVAALVCEGCTAEKAAHQLAISEYTVRQHLKAVFGKVGISRQADLVAIVSKIS